MSEIKIIRCDACGRDVKSEDQISIYAPSEANVKIEIHAGALRESLIDSRFDFCGIDCLVNFIQTAINPRTTKG